MAVVQSLKASSTWAKIVFVILLVTNALAWTSFVTASWGDAYFNNALSGYGLWRRCGENELVPNCVKLMGWNLDWYRAVQAFAIMGFVSVNVSLLFIILLIFVQRLIESKTLCVWLSVLGFWSALCYVLAIIVFATKFDSAYSTNSNNSQKLDYGWGMAVTVLLLQIVVGILMVIEARSKGAKFMDL